MGQAKQRGSFEQRKAAAIARDGGEKQKRPTAFERRQKERSARRALWFMSIAAAMDKKD